jgi:hypothetical protein
MHSEKTGKMCLRDMAVFGFTTKSDLPSLKGLEKLWPD